MNEFNNSSKISVIIPTYNYGGYIGEAIKSVLSQSYKNIEIIIIDNYSDDQTEETISSFDSKLIKYFKFKNNGIIAASRNYGIDKSSGEFIAFLDADDIWCPQKLEEQIKHFQENSIVGVGTDAIIISQTPYYRQIDFGRSQKGYKDYDYTSIFSVSPIKTSSVVVRENVIKKVGGFDENPKFRCIEDFELWLRMAQFGNFRILGKKLLYYRMHYDKKRNNIDISMNIFEILRKHIASGYLKDPESISEAESTINLSIGYNYLFTNSYEGRHYYLNAFRKSSKSNKKIKALVGYILSTQPPIIRNPLNYLLHKIDKIITFIKN